jgi:hypothetical protein
MKDFARKMISAAAWIALSAVAAATAVEAASPVTVKDTRVFPESITATSDGTLLISGLEKGIIYGAAPGATTAEAWITREHGSYEHEDEK